jgi:hypothetical protein
MLLRRVEPEILDQLSPDDPRALRARRDLERANVLMCQDRIMAHLLRKYWRGGAPRVLVDLGSGNGSLMLRVARRLAAHWHGVHVILIDRQVMLNSEVRSGFAALNWSVEPVRADALDFFASQRNEGVDAVTANLFLHHLQDSELAKLLAQAAQATRLFIACEMQRTWLVRELGRMQWMIGGGDVICHDGVVSARASFRGAEISALWPGRGDWNLFERALGPMAHVFAAQRRDGS